MNKRVKALPECRKDKIRKWDDTYETVRCDIEAGVIGVPGTGGKTAKNVYTKEEVDALLVENGKEVKKLTEALASLEKQNRKDMDALFAEVSARNLK